MVKIAIVGASSHLGREMLSLMAEDGILAEDVLALEPASPLGTLVSYGEDDELDVLNLNDFDFSKADVAVFVCSKEIAKRYIPKAASKNIKIVDASGVTVSDTDVPMIVKSLNDADVQKALKNIVATPSALTTQILKPLSAIHQKLNIKRLVVSGYISVSQHSKEAMDELFTQTRKIYMNAPIVEDEEIFKKQIAFNVLPQIGSFIGEETEAEWALNAEVKRVLKTDVKVHANLAYVPVFIGNGAYVNVETQNEADLDQIRDMIKSVNGVVLFDKNTDGGYVSLNDVQGENDIYVSRVRQDLSVQNGFSFWVVADNLRASGAGNVLDVAKLLLLK